MENDETILTEQDWEKIPPSIKREDAISGFSKLMDFAREASITHREIAKYESAERIMITEITKKYDFYHTLLAYTFEERRIAIEKHFEIIDKGINENDHALINTGLSELSKIIASSPFGNIKEFHNLIETNQLPAL